MLTLVGIGHVFSIRDAIKQIIFEKKPDIVCVELDKLRFENLERGQRGSEDLPFIFKRLQRIYEKAAETQGANVGEEMIAAVEAAKEMDIPHEFIDVEATPLVGNLLENLSIGQKTKLMGSVLMASVLPKKNLEEGIKMIEDDPEQAIEQFERAFPTLKRDIVDYRDKYMSERIVEITENFSNVIVIAGEGHIPGLTRYLGDLDIEVIHLKQVMELAEKLRSGSVKMATLPKPGKKEEKTNSSVTFTFEIESNDLV